MHCAGVFLQFMWRAVCPVGQSQALDISQVALIWLRISVMAHLAYPIAEGEYQKISLK